MPSALEEALLRVAAPSSSIDRTLVTYVIGRFCPRLRANGAMYCGTHPVALRRSDLAGARIREGSHMATLKIDGENFFLLQIPRELYKVATATGINAVRSKVGTKRERESVARSSSKKNDEEEPPKSSDGDDDDDDVLHRIYLIGRGDNRLFVLKSTFASFSPNNSMIFLDGELALRRRAPDDAALARERARTLRSYAWDVVASLPEDDGSKDDRVLTYVVHDCLFARNYTGATSPPQRLAVATSLVNGNNPLEAPPLRLGAPHQFNVIYKRHASARNAVMLLHDVDPSMIGFDCDGIILTPTTGPFKIGSDTNLFKLKPPGLQTLDLRVNIAACTHPHRGNECHHDVQVRLLWCAATDECSLTNSSGRCTQARQHVLGACAKSNFSFAVDQNAIVEFAPRLDDRREITWFPVRLRADKLRPNARRTIESTLEALRDAVSYEEVFALLS